MEQYIKVFRHGNSIYDIYRDENGLKKYNKFSNFDAELFIKSDKSTSTYVDVIDKNPLDRIPIKTFQEFKEVKEKYADVGINLYGVHSPENQYRRKKYYEKDTFPNHKIAYFDIETAFEGSYLDSQNDIVYGVGGFPKPESANAPITAIDVFMDGKHVCLSLKKCSIEQDETFRYRKCDDEEDLIVNFFKVISIWNPDILTGWNAFGFDFPFIINRMKRLEIDLKIIDPMGLININQKTGEVTPKSYYWLDMQELYKKFTFEPRESYSLQAIAEAELGDGKVEYHDSGNLEQIYNNSFDLFIEYNKKDVDLLVQIDKKINLLPLTIEMSYVFNVNFDDVMGTTSPWGQLVYCETRKLDKILPEKRYTHSSMDFDGGYVASNPGFYRWIVSFDYASLYPSIIQAFNLCPSTYIKEMNLPQELKLLRQKFRISHSESDIEYQLNASAEDKVEINSVLKKYNVSMTCSGHFFRNDEEGISPYLMKKIYKERKDAKKLMQKYEREYYDLPKTASEEEKFRLKSLISKWNNTQMAKKIALNSFFGACGNAYYILSSLEVAESITSCGRFYDKKSGIEVSKVLQKKFYYDRYPMIAADTDSCYFYLEPIIKKSGLTDNEEITDYIDKQVIPIIDKIIEKNVLQDIAYQRNIRVPEVMDMKREAIANVGIYIGKKNYALNLLDNEGTRYPDGKTKIIGLNIKKTNLPKFIRNKMLEFLKILFTDNESKFQQEFLKFKGEFRTFDIQDISFPKGVNIITDKNRPGVESLGGGKYLYTLQTSGLPIHVRAALVYNEYIKEKNLTKKYTTVENGSKIKFVLLKIPNSVGNQKTIGYPNDHTHKTFIEDNDLLKFVDYDEMFNGLVVMPLEPLVSAKKWDFEKRNKLSDFF